MHEPSKKVCDQVVRRPDRWNGPVCQYSDAIISAIQSGNALPGEQLPTQRELAQRFGVAVGTVTRAYAEATRRGFLRSTVGRGTFVATRTTTGASPIARPLQCFDLTISRPPPEGCNPELVRALGQIHRRADCPICCYTSQSRGGKNTGSLAQS